MTAMDDYLAFLSEAVTPISGLCHQSYLGIDSEAYQVVIHCSHGALSNSMFSMLLLFELAAAKSVTATYWLTTHTGRCKLNNSTNIKT